MQDEFDLHLTPTEIKREYQYLRSYLSPDDFSAGSASWFPIAIMGCKLTTFSSPLMKERLTEFYNISARVSQLGATGCRKRGSKTWLKRRSYAWIDGKRVYASTGGVYRRA